jgi:hypothetical protein
MSDERRYDGDEIARIFEAAANPQRHRDRPTPAAGDGLTLVELQEIGREVGLSPESIAEAAHSLDESGRAMPRRTVAGVPIGVGRVASLPRFPTDHEWEIIVSDLRATFAASGREVSSGGVRRWTNGNLHAYIEPTEGGYRLRMGTRKGDAGALAAIGIGWIAIALFSIAGGLFGGGVSEILKGIGFGAFGAGAFAFNVIRLPRWAREREEQMEYIASRVAALLRKAEPVQSGGESGAARLQSEGPAS